MFLPPACKSSDPLGVGANRYRLTWSWTTWAPAAEQLEPRRLGASRIVRIPHRPASSSGVGSGQQRFIAADAGKARGMARLEDYSFGRVTVDGQEHTRDLIVLPGRVVSDWWRREGHSLAIEDLDEVLDELPGRLVLGVGAHGRLRPDPAVIAELERRGVRVECLPTDAAVRRYGELDARATAAALHLTC
jgi:hypothetical protein